MLVLFTLFLFIGHAVHQSISHANIQLFCSFSSGPSCVLCELKGAMAGLEICLQSVPLKNP